ncbi:MAG: hypothetical protein D3910_04015, partial [Candidatus Electrothrix sp. ATG2]|nr:hypothetical protein [Candidatus Electrothrix sp. ATG2]
MDSRSKKYMSSALLLLLSSPASFSAAQEKNTTGTSSVPKLPMATVIYNDHVQDQGALVDNKEQVVESKKQGVGQELEKVPSVVLSEPENEVVNHQHQDEVEEESNLDGRVFGYRNGYIHAALGVSGEWTDNLYNTDTEKEENFLTKISPSVWLTWPRRSRRPLQVAADNTPVGGLQYSLAEYDVYNKFEVYLAGKSSFMTYSADSEQDHVEHGLQAQMV